MQQFSRFFIIVFVAVIALPAQAATITVTTTANSLADDGDCSLREAIDNANADTADNANRANDPTQGEVRSHGDCPADTGTTFMLGGADTIVLANSSYGLKPVDYPAGDGVDNNNNPGADNWWYGPNALPAIASEITIEGNGAQLVITDDAGTGSPIRLRFFYIGPDPELNGTINFHGPKDGSGAQPGGKLTLSNLTLTGGRQLGGSAGTAGAGAGLGGALFNQGELVLQGITLNQNQASGGMINSGPSGGGGIGEDSSFNDGGGFGGRVPFGNGAAGEVGNGRNGGAGSGPTDGSGGDGQDSTGDGGLSGYGSGGGAGGFSFGGTNGDGGAGGAGFTGGPGSGADGLIGGFGQGGIAGFFFGGGTGGGVGGGGGGGLNGGGGGFGGGGGGNDGGGGFGGGGSPAGFGGGEVFIGDESAGGGGAGMGGALFNHGGSSEIRNSSFSQNSANGGANDLDNGAGGDGLGGAVFNLNGSVMLVHSTLSGNTVSVSGNAGTEIMDGAAIYSLPYHLFNNDPEPRQMAEVHIESSILFGNASGEPAVTDLVTNHAAGTPANHASEFIIGPSFIGKWDKTGSTLPVGGSTEIDPQLDPAGLADNGGLTQTIALLTASPAIDVAGDCVSDNGTSSDQRGIPRPQDAACDAGAYEFQIPIATLNVDNSTLAEDGSNTATLTASLSSPYPTVGPVVTVTLLITDSSTASTEDYTQGGTLTLTIPAGAAGSEDSLTLTAVEDVIDENPDEIIEVEIDNVTNGVENGSQQQTITIADNDGPPALSVTDATASETDGVLSFTISKGGESSQNVSVEVATTDGSASQPDDYAPVADTLIFLPGETMKTVDVSLVDDALFEADENLILTLSNVSANATINDGSATGTITSDDARPVITISMAPGTVTTAKVNNKNVVMLAADISVPAYPEDLLVSTLELTASGSGHDRNDVTAVKLWQDDGDGKFDAGKDTQIATGIYSADNGSLSLNGNVTLQADSTTRLYVTYDFNNKLAVLALPMLAGIPLLAGFGLIGLGGARRRTIILIVLVGTASLAISGCTDERTNSDVATCVATLSINCPSSKDDDEQTETFRVAPTSVTASFTSGTGPTVTGLPIAGPLVTVSE